MASVLGTMMVTIENIPGPNAGNASHMRKDEAGISASYKAACALPTMTNAIEETNGVRE